MNASDVSDLLDFVSTFDGRITVTEQRCEAWALALNKDLPYDFAHSIIVKHYASDSTAITPADFNSIWFKELNRIYESNKSKAIEYDRTKSGYGRATPEQVTFWVGEAKRLMAETIAKARAEGKTTFPLAGDLSSALNGAK